eukprot:Pgem_evm1s1092
MGHLVEDSNFKVFHSKKIPAVTCASGNSSLRLRKLIPAPPETHPCASGIISRLRNPKRTSLRLRNIPA